MQKINSICKFVCSKDKAEVFAFVLYGSSNVYENHGWTDKIKLQFMQLFRLMTIIIFRVMMYSSISMLPVLLMILLLALDHTSGWHKGTSPVFIHCMVLEIQLISSDASNRT